METCYVTFGQRYRHEKHPCDRRAHPDGWFEFRADTYDQARAAASAYLTPRGKTIPLYSSAYADDDWDPSWYPSGRLARFKVGPGLTVRVDL